MTKVFGIGIGYYFVARQHAMHAERDIVLPLPSVCPSHYGIVSK